ncbi:MAG: hypothetical protein L0K86_25300 [Actinomycetia bacterium]|nr:hypothetical protein [Actinomycetes bacterium]
MSSPGDASPVTVASFDNGERPFILIGFPLVGALIGWAVRPVAEWASGIDQLPFGSITDVIAGWDSLWATVVPIAVGLIAGLAFALYAIHDTVKVTIDRHALTLNQGDRSTTFDRAEIDAVYVEAKRLVVLDRQTAELASELFDADPTRLASELLEHSYPWFDADPYASAYRRWLDGSPDLSDAEHFVLRTRGKALADDDEDDLADLRQELSRLGLVVRDEGNRQYWRRAR